jgi:hypothetical protein
MLDVLRRTPRTTGLRAALRDVRETYRRHSAAPRDGTPQAQPQEPTRPARLTRPARPTRQRRPADPPAARPVPTGDPDVYLDVSDLRVDEITLKLEELRARVALDARVLDLLKLNVGVDAELRGVDLEIRGVEAQALLKVRLENLTAIVDRVMSTIDNNPEILRDLTRRVGETLDEVNRGLDRLVEP